MKILGIESSCDETAAAVVEFSEDKKNIRLLSSVTATSLQLHAKTGGIIPEIAARNQIKDIIPVIYEALEKAKCLEHSARSKNTNLTPAIDQIAVTYGPGLIGSLLVGVETAKTLSFVWDKPLIPVNHLFGHVFANFLITENQPYKEMTFPAIGLIVSGGHTDLLFMKSPTDTTWLGGTRDDAAGEAFDKIGRMIGLAYPAGPMIEKLAKNGNPKAYHLPRPLKYDKELDFSFSGLKTAALRIVEKYCHSERSEESLDELTKADISRATQDAIIDVIVYKTLQAVKKYNVKSLLIGGGVAANQTLIDTFKNELTTKYQTLDTKIFVPQKSLCTDNAAMIATAAAMQPTTTSWKNLSANPELYFD